MWFLMSSSRAGPTNLHAKLQSNLRLAIPEAGVTLAGELALPPTPGPHPAVVMVGGLDDGNRALKEALTGQGVAVVTYDHRGSGQSTGTFSTWAPEVMADDALSWIRWLQKHPDIDRARIGLIGHSQGGVAAAVVAAKATNEVAFVVLLAAIGVPVMEWQLQQISDVAQSLGVNPTTAAKLVAFQRELFQEILAVKDDADAKQRARNSTTAHLARFTSEERTQLGLTDAQSDVFVKQAGDAAYRQFLAYDPRPTLRRVRCPVLALHGSADQQVSAAKNLASVVTELRSSGNPQIKALELPGLDHEFLVQSTNSPPNVPPGGGAFSFAALRLISEWITEQTKK